MPTPVESPENLIQTSVSKADKKITKRVNQTNLASLKFSAQQTWNLHQNSATINSHMTTTSPEHILLNAKLTGHVCARK